MDYGQYLKNPLYVSFEEFKEGMTKRKENELRREFRAQSDYLCKDKGNEEKTYKSVLQIVYSVNEEERRKGVINKTLENIKSF